MACRKLLQPLSACRSITWPGTSGWVVLTAVACLSGGAGVAAQLHVEKLAVVLSRTARGSSCAQRTTRTYSVTMLRILRVAKMLMETRSGDFQEDCARCSVTRRF